MYLSALWGILKLIFYKTFYADKFRYPLLIAVSDSYIAIASLKQSSLLSYSLFPINSFNLDINNLSSHNQNQLFNNIELYKKQHYCCSCTFPIDYVLIKNIDIPLDSSQFLYETLYQEISLSLMANDIFLDYIINNESKTHCSVTAVIVKNDILASYYKFIKKIGSVISKISIDVYVIANMLLVIIPQAQTFFNSKYQISSSNPNLQNFNTNNILFLCLEQTKIMAILIYNGNFQDYFKQDISELVVKYDDGLKILLDRVNAYLADHGLNEVLGQYLIIIADQLANNVNIALSIKHYCQTKIFSFGEIYQYIYLNSVNSDIPQADLNLLYKAISLSYY